MAHQIKRGSALLAILLASVSLSACGAGERLGQLNPFQGEETDDPTAPEASQRISILELQDRISASDATNQPVILPTAYTNDRWPMADGYPTHALQHTQASGNLSRLWRVDVGNGSSRGERMNARPVLLDNVIYTLDAEGRLSARNAETGAELWVHRFEGPNDNDRYSFGGAVAVDSGRVFAHAGYNYFVALDASSGEELWRAHTITPFHTAPTVFNGVVYVGTDDNELVALDANTGGVMWNHRGIEETARLLTTPSPAVAGDVLVVPYTSGELYALRAQNGTPLWSDSLTRAGGLTPMSSINDIAGSPVIMGDQVYAMSHSGILAAFDLTSGEQIWTQPAGGLNAPWVAGDYLFLVTTEAQVVAFERMTGAIRWISQLEVYEKPNKRKDRIAWAGPVLAGNRLILAGSNGDLVFVNPTDGTVMETRDLGEAVYIAPIVANETVYVLTDEAHLIALR